MSELKSAPYPVMPLRDIVLFPGMVAPLVVGRKNSIRALEYALEERSLIFLVAQKDAGVNEPFPQDLYSYGVLASVVQLLRLPDGTMKALVEGKFRAKVLTYFAFADFSLSLSLHTTEQLLFQHYCFLHLLLLIQKYFGILQTP